MGGGNLGDGGSLDAVIQNIRRRWPGSEIQGLSMNPDDTEGRHGIPSFPIRTERWTLFPAAAKDNDAPTFRTRLKRVMSRYPPVLKLIRATKKAVMSTSAGPLLRESKFLTRSFRIVRSLDLLVISGGGQLVEYKAGPMAVLGGPWSFPYTIFKWTLLAKLAGVRCIVLNVGAGPVVTSLGTFFIRNALRLAEYVSFRDDPSRVLARGIGFKGESEVYPDCAYALDSPALHASRSGERRRPVVGFAPMAFGDPRLSSKHDPSFYDHYIQKLGSFGSWLLRNGYDVTLFCTDIGNDPPVVEDLQRILEADADPADTGSRGSLTRVHQWSTDDLLSNMSSMDFAVVVRFHAVVLAHMTNIPLIAVNHHPKVSALMSDLGLPEYCVNVERCELDVLVGAFDSLVNSRHEIKTRMAEKADRYRRQLAAQFDRLFPADAVTNP
jgi:polysaccharide pyruvyl transferase WcaK-like protein